MSNGQSVFKPQIFKMERNKGRGEKQVPEASFIHLGLGFFAP